MSKIIYAFALIVALLVAGCASSPTNTPAATPTQPAIEDEWTVTMTHSGGIMGLMRTVEVTSDGSYTVTDERSKSKVIRELNEADLATLHELVSNVELRSPEDSRPSVCADCFIYDIEIQSNGKISTIQLSDITLPGSGMENLVSFLRGLIDSALK
jgi:hypothetical protein